MAPGARRKLHYAKEERTSAREGARPRTAQNPVIAAPASLAAGTAPASVPAVEEHAPSVPGAQQGAIQGRGSAQGVVPGGEECGGAGVGVRRLTATRGPTPRRSLSPGPTTTPPTSTPLTTTATTATTATASSLSRSVPPGSSSKDVGKVGGGKRKGEGGRGVGSDGDPATVESSTGRPAVGVAGRQRGGLGGKRGGVKRPRVEKPPTTVVRGVRGRKMRGVERRQASTLPPTRTPASRPPAARTPTTPPPAAPATTTRPPAAPATTTPPPAAPATTTRPPAAPATTTPPPAGATTTTTPPPAGATTTTTQPPTTLPTTTTTTTTTPKTFYGGKGGVKTGGRGKAVPVSIRQLPPRSPRCLIGVGRPSQPATPATTRNTPSKFSGILFEDGSDEEDNTAFDHLETERSGWARDEDSGDDGDHEDDHGASQQFGDEGDESDPDDPGYRQDASAGEDDDDEGEDEGDDDVPRRPRRIPDVVREFEWSPCSEFEPELFDFSAAQSGLSAAWPCNADSQEVDYFLAFFDGDIMNVIVDETNKYYQWVRARTEYLGPRSRFAFWQDCHVEEMLVFLALFLLMPLCKKHNLREYWKKESLLPTPVFGKFLARDRFLMLLSFLHFADNATPNRSDPIWKIRPIMSRLTNNFRKYFYPFRKVVIDESLMLFKGRLAFKQYIPSKRHRFGVKLFVLCDCETGFILDCIVYSASDADIPAPTRNDPLGLSGQIVKTMLEPYLGRGHTLYTDNWYTSPFLCQYLHQVKTGSCGTVKHTRKHMPRFPVDEREDLPHPSESDTPDTDDADKLAAHRRRKLRRSRNPKSINRQKSGKVLAVKWTDRRDVHLLSTVHQGKMVDTGATHWKTKKPIKKPDIVTDYTDNMRLIDKADCMLSGTECVRQSTKWYQKLFFHLVDLAMLNAYIAWLCATSDPEKPKLKFRSFVHEVCFQLLERYGSVSAVKSGRGRRAVARPDRIQQSEYISRHHLDKTPETEGGSRKHEQRRCAYCAKKVPPKITRVTTMCPGCDVGLCLGECFVQWHTVRKI